MGQTNSSQVPIYISPEDDLVTICARIESIAAREIILVIPSQNQLKTSGTWHTLYLHARKYDKKVQVISNSAYIRSIARSVRFKAAKTLDELSHAKPTYTRPTPRFAPPLISKRKTDEGEGINFFFAHEDVDIAQPAPPFPSGDLQETPLSFLFEEDEDLPSLRPMEPSEPFLMPSVRKPKPPTPVNMPPAHRGPQPPPRLPWDDDNDVPAPQHPKFVRRATNPLVRSMRQGRGRIRTLRRRRSEPLRFVTVVPIVLIAIFVLVRSIVRYLKRQGM